MTTYSQLKSDIALWTARDDIAAVVETLILLAEKQVNRRIRILEMETDTTLSFASADYSQDTPTGYVGMKHIFNPNANNPKCVYTPPSKFHLLNNLPNDAFNAIRGDAGLIYTVESGKIKVHAPVGATDPFDLDITYFKRLTALSDAEPTHYALENHYDLYLWGGLKEAWDFVDDDRMMQKYQARFNGVLEEINTEEKGKRRAAQPHSRRPPEQAIY